MIYLLDTNTCIQYLTGRSSKVMTHLRIILKIDIALCDVVKGKLYYGTNLYFFEFFSSFMNNAG